MDMRDELRNEMQAPEGGRTLGEAANRWVTYQMIFGVIGLAVFVLFMLLFFLPVWRSFP